MEKLVGTVTHFYSHLSVAAIQLRERLAVGDRVHIKGHTTELVQTVESMEIEHQEVQEALPGQDVAIQVAEHVREHDQIFLVIPD